MIKLYGIRQSRAVRSLWALEELGLQYEHVPTNFTTDAKQPEYLAINPNGRIPALVDGDVTLFESMAINLYLAKKYDTRGLYPKSAADEARAIQWSFWGMTETEQALLQVLMNRVFLPAPQRDEAAAKAGEEKLAQPLRVLDGALAGKQYLLGDGFTIADLNVASVLAWALFAKTDLSKTPNVARWLGECCGRPAFVKAQRG
ncbi:MAG: glutathione S-transferase family protein [Myxococcota bacterium]